MRKIKRVGGGVVVGGGGEEAVYIYLSVGRLPCSSQDSKLSGPSVFLSNSAAKYMHQCHEEYIQGNLLLLH